MKPIFALVLFFLLAPAAALAGTPDEDAAVRELYLTYQSGTVPPLELVQPDIIWHCTYFHAEKSSIYRASTYMKFYKQRKDRVIRSVMQVTYPRKVTATTYYAYTSYGFVSLPGDSNMHTSIRQVGPNRMIIEYFEAAGPLGGGHPQRAASLTAPGTAIGYSACLSVN